MEHPTGPARVFELEQRVRDEVDGACYRVIRLIGRGGMGEVYEVVHEDTHQHFAMKCLQAHLARNPTVLRRAWHEAAALRNLRHDNVVAVHATGVREDGVIWMMMDLLDGFTLREVLADLTKVPVPWALRILRDAALGLTAVHGFAIHRDLKPENIHLGRDGVTRVLDLGAGKFHHLGVTTSGHAHIGTVPYMSPEQIRSPQAIDGRSDVFSAGIVLYELLSGKHPFAASGVDEMNVFQLVAAIIGPPHAPLASVAPWVAPNIVAIVDRCLEKETDRRFANAAELASALTTALEQVAGTTGPAPPLTTLTEALRRLRSVRQAKITGDESTALAADGPAAAGSDRGGGCG